MDKQETQITLRPSAKETEVIFMKTIGFVDYYINEWHADNYPRWINEACEALGLEYQVRYCWAEMDISPVNGKTTAEWCETHQVTRCATIEELCNLCDHVIVLAPSNPEKHLEYAQEVLKYGKRSYIDKTFAPDLATAEKIFSIGQAHGTQFFSTSALRYASELDALKGATANAIITGGGKLFEEYIIHLVEMAVVLFPESHFVRAKTECVGKQRICRCQSEDGKEAVLVYSPSFGYSVTAESQEHTFSSVNVSSPFFVNLIQDILRFFESGNLPFPSKQTIEAMRLRDALLKSEKQDGVWLSL